MPVFISHRTQDDAIAQRIHDRLNGYWGITCYLDHLDPSTKTTNSITKTILEALERSTHLLAVISYATRESWWVPYEIGVAQRGSRRITSYKSTTVDLPEYLTEWPILETDSEIDSFAQAYKRDSSAPTLRGKSLLSEADYSVQNMKADTFHRDLKRVLNQR